MLWIFFQSLLLSAFLFLVLRKWLPIEKKRWGGAVMIFVFICLTLWHSELELSRQLVGLLLGSGAILLFGLVDDKKNFSWVSQLVFQFFLALALFFFGFQIDFFKLGPEQIVRLDQIVFWGIAWPSIFFVLVWFLVSVNAVNWFDGSDSALAGLALVAGLGLLYVSFLPEVNQPAIGILSAILLGAVTAFLFFNLPPAKLEAGTSGSYFIAFVLAGLAIMAGSKILTLMIVLILPLLDFFWVLVGRWRRGQSIFQRDKSHLHHRLQKIGWQDRDIFLLYMSFLTVVLIIYSLLTDRWARLGLLFSEALIILLFFSFVQFRLKKIKS